jgi:1,4-alpha-glucan branching enzyme
MTKSLDSITILSDTDLYLFNQGTHYHLYEKLGAHAVIKDGAHGICFSVWAPNARQVSVCGDFNAWNKRSHLLHSRGQSGIWEGFFPGLGTGLLYKYYIISKNTEYKVLKADPFAFFNEVSPKTSSIVWDLKYEWGDTGWMQNRAKSNALQSPMSIYEIHLGSWQRVPAEGNRYLSYRELAPRLASYIKETGFTHVEFMPIMEHPFYGSWGYQITGYFAATSRYGTPQDLMYLIDYLHQQNIGVILDWVPSHFPTDEHGPGFFDGTHLYEHNDPRQGIHPEWNSYIFNFNRNEVKSFLISNAIFWLDKYHVDGLRVDAVASMLYLDYGRKKGEWIPNIFGGNESLEAVDFLRRLNEVVYQNYPDVQTIAEESTSWPGVSRPVYLGGLGFGLKWDMGWMHDTLSYMKKDPVHRKYHHNDLTFRLVYAFFENFVLPFSHDEVVHGKSSLLNKMPGDDWQKFANLRLLLGYMYAQPGKKLLFMGSEFGQRREWSHEASLDWHLLEYKPHSGVKDWVADLNRLYRDNPALHVDFEPSGFAWIDINDAEHSVISLMRLGKNPDDVMIAAFNFTPVPRYDYKIGVPSGGFWNEILNSDAREYGGSGQGNLGGIMAVPVTAHGRPYSLNITIPPLGVVFFTPGYANTTGVL